MRTLATLMVSISLLTAVLFAHALITFDEQPDPVVVEQVAQQ
jgi:hypothetical protein